MDFDSYPQWQEYWTLEPEDTYKPTVDLKAGDKLTCVYMGSPVKCVVVVGHLVTSPPEVNAN
jgi:hypothetical protein